ncbi:site-specific integrase [Sphingomonas sp. BK345]|uniref:tyrosine-type recombinase/integrase n=1 Tax=Sphingomonas sp. BK345 TaxID=2586980 RepID=UPI00161AF720|nr:site-specific integrase [Sphingomonas sp. BK345]MBB3474027.1 integrase [Sphingomonas sp. BK345]
MATITKRGQRWSVQIRRKGVPAQSRTFSSKAAASAWATVQEAKIEAGEMPISRSILQSITVAQLLERYLEEVTPKKRSEVTERYRLRQMQRDSLGRVSLSGLESRHIADYRDRRLTSVKAGTIRRELSLLQHAFDIAQKEWGYCLASNPVRDVRQPALRNARNRRLEVGEYERLEAAIDMSRNTWLRPIVRLAIETGLRRGEIIDLQWRWIDMRQRMAHIPHTKTGQPRTIPLTDGALQILEGLDRSGDKVFPITANALKLAWTRAVRRSSLIDLRFHDLRHEAVSRFFELGLSLPEVAIISGHRDPRMLFRYTHLRPTELAIKLQGRRWSNGAEDRTAK